MIDALVYNLGNTIHNNYSYALIAANMSVFIFGLIGFFPLSVRPEEDSSTHFKSLIRRGCWFVIVGISTVLLSFSYIFGERGEFNRELLPSNEALVFILVVFLVGSSITFLWLRIAVPNLHSLRERFKVTQTSDATSDVRAEFNAAAKTKNFNPKKYILSHDRKKPLYFLGLDEKDKPIYCDEEEWMGNHKIAIGPTQVGKGVDIGVDLYQSILGGHCTIMIDPKPDKHARSIMIDACKETERELIEIDLTGSIASDDYALLKSGSTREKRTRLQRIFKLEDKGTDADHYKVAERAKLTEFLKISPNSFYELFKSILLYTKAAQEKSVLKGSKERASEIAEVVSLQDDGVDIRAAILRNACIYVRCSTADRTVISLSTALLEDIVQSVFATSPELGGRRNHHVFIEHDEIRFTMNDFIATSLATIKGSNCHMSIAFQSFEDLRNIPDVSADKDSIALSIKVNCTHKLIYRADDDKQAEWAALQTFVVNKSVVDRAQIDINKAGAEVFTGERSLTSQQEALFSASKFAMLNPRVGVLCRPSQLATLVKTCWIDTDLVANMPQVVNHNKTSIMDQVNFDMEEADKARIEGSQGIDNKKGETGNSTQSRVKPLRELPAVKPKLEDVGDPIENDDYLELSEVAPEEKREKEGHEVQSAPQKEDDNELERRAIPIQAPEHVEEKTTLYEKALSTFETNKVALDERLAEIEADPMLGHLFAGVDSETFTPELEGDEEEPIALRPKLVNEGRSEKKPESKRKEKKSRRKPRRSNKKVSKKEGAPNKKNNHKKKLDQKISESNTLISEKADEIMRMLPVIET